MNLTENENALLQVIRADADGVMMALVAFAVAGIDAQAGECAVNGLVHKRLLTVEDLEGKNSPYDMQIALPCTWPDADLYA